MKKVRMFWYRVVVIGWVAFMFLCFFSLRLPPGFRIGLVIIGILCCVTGSFFLSLININFDKRVQEKLKELDATKAVYEKAKFYLEEYVYDQQMLKNKKNDKNAKEEASDSV